MCWGLHRYQTCDVLGRLEHVNWSYEKTVFHSDHVVTIATTFDEISKLTHICVSRAWRLAHMGNLNTFYHLHRSYSNIVLNGEGCVAMATAFEENSLLSYWCVEGRTINCHLKSGAVWTIFHRVMTTLCFMARDLSPWQRHMMTSHNWRRAVQG